MQSALKLAAVLLFAGSASTAGAVTVNWTDFESEVPNSSVSGTITTPGGPVAVTFNGSYGFAQLGSGINYWTEGSPAPYTGGSVDNAPPAAEMIALNAGGAKTITFSETVSDVYLALISWNGNSGTFDQPFEVISQGQGYWGTGSFQNLTPTSFTSPGELHAIIRFTGSFDQVSFTDLTENWHGIQIGIAGLAPVIPEPATWALMLLGLGATGGALRRRQQVRLRYAG